MRKQIDFVLNYRENGQQCSTLLSIDFVSNYYLTEYNKIMQMVYDTQRCWDSITSAMARRRSAEINGEEDKIKSLDSEIDKLSLKIQGYGESGIFQRRFQLVKVLLTDNGVTDDKFQDFDFWDRCVDPSDLNELLTQSAWKDIDKKKAL